MITVLRAGRSLKLPLGEQAPVTATAKTADTGKPNTAPSPRQPDRTATQATAIPVAPGSPPPPVPLPSRPVATADQPLRPLTQPASAVRLATGHEPVTSADDREAVLLREDDDFTIRVSQGATTRLLVLTPDGRRVFDGRIDSPERLAKIPPVLRPRVDAMVRVLGPPVSTSPKELPGVAPIAIRR